MSAGIDEASQELRHQDLGDNNLNGSSSSTSLSTITDQALIRLDATLESTAQNISLISQTMEPIMAASSSARTQTNILLDLSRKHNLLLAEWESVQREASILRDELKEDKWLAVFRAASDQCTGMMTSLQKIVDQCQAFVSTLQNPISTAETESILQSRVEMLIDLQKSLEAKKKYYVPSVSKVLSVLDKGVRDRVTKNGECLRRHADMRIRWKDLRERLDRTDAAMDMAVNLVNRDTILRDDEDSTLSINFETPSRSRASSTSAMARSMSPLRKLAARVSRSGKPREPVTPARPPARMGGQAGIPVSEPIMRHRTSLFQLKQPNEAYNTDGNSLQTGSTSQRLVSGQTTGAKPRWSYATHPDPEDNKSAQTIRQTVQSPGRLSSSTLGGRSQTPRSASRMSQARSISSNFFINKPATDVTVSRPSSRQAHNRSESRLALRSRPSSPSHIPAPNFTRNFTGRGAQADSLGEDVLSLMVQRAMSPSALSMSPNATPQTTPVKKLRRQSQLPLPTNSLRASTPSFSRSVSPAPSSGARNPNLAHSLPSNSMLHKSPPTVATRNNIKPRPPSSYRDGSVTPSRPPSRSILRGRITPGPEREPLEVHEYIPGNSKDPLDVQVAIVVNSCLHGYRISRVDPPLKKLPPMGTENRAQYAFENAYGRKVLSCRLLLINRSAPRSLEGHISTKKVMVRVGGGWQDLEAFVLSKDVSRSQASLV